MNSNGKDVYSSYGDMSENEEALFGSDNERFRNADEWGKCVTEWQRQVYDTFRRLWIEHVLWTRSAINSIAFGLADADAVTKRLLQNPVDFANALRPFYGDRIANRFQELFTEHLLIAAQLVTAAKAGDTAAVDEQRRRWYINADDIAIFLESINPYWKENVWKQLLHSHLKMTENEATQILTGKYADSIVQYDAIQSEAIKMADFMTLGLMKQFEI